MSRPLPSLHDADAEALLDRRPVGPGHERLVATLAAAAAPAAVPVMDATLRAAFRATQAHGERSSRRRLARWFSVKIISAVVGALAAGGLAVAATTGALVTPGHSPPRARPAPSATSVSVSTSNPTPTAVQPAPSPTPSTPRTPLSVVDACRTYQAAAEPNKALDDASMAELVGQAGGKKNVEEFCETLLTTREPSPDVPRTADAGPPATPTPSPAASPTQKQHPSHPSHPAHPTHPAHPSKSKKNKDD